MNHFEAGKRMKALRLQSGISQDDLAVLTKLSLRTIQRIENGETAPRGDSLKRIAAALQVSVAEFITASHIASTDESLKEDKSILLLLHFAAFGYLITPILGILLPIIIWLIYKDKIKLANKTGKQIIKFQTGWCFVLLLAYGYLFSLKFLHLSLPAPKNGKVVSIVIAVLYVFNSLNIIISLLKFVEIKKYITRLSPQ
jgi:transcriptional regulator with XRE-family HTH domain